MDTILRVTLIIYIFTSFGVAGYLTKTINPYNNLLNIIFVIGFVFYTIASITLTIGHKTEERNVLEMLAVVLYPVLVYFILFQKIDYLNKEFWIFQGFFLFLMITGGFILGLLFSPLLAKLQNFSWTEVSSIVKFGFNFIKNLKMSGFAIIMFSGIIGALFYFSSNLILRLNKLSSIQKTEFAVLLILALVIFIRYSYRHTIFNLNKDPNLRNQYVKHNLLER